MVQDVVKTLEQLIYFNIINILRLSICGVHIAGNSLSDIALGGEYEKGSDYRNFGRWSWV